MKRLLPKNLFFLFFLLGNVLYGQNPGNKFTRENFKGDMTNVDVIDAKIWHHQGLTEKSLKKGLEIISSNVQLTSIDSFNAYQVLAYNFRTLGADELALDYAKKAVRIMQRIEPADPLKSSWIALYYSTVKQYDQAIVYLKKNIAQFQQKKDTLSILKLYNDIGFIYSLNSQSDSAIKYYEMVIQSGQTAEVYQGIIGLTTGNLGDVYLKRGDYEKALAYVKIDAELSEHRNKTSYYNALNTIGECYLLMKKYTEAKAILLKLLNYQHADRNVSLTTYQLLVQVYEKTKEYDKSFYYLKKQIALEESVRKEQIPIETIVKQLSDAKIDGIKKDLELSKSMARSEEFKNEIYLVTLLVFFIFVFLLLLYIRNRLLRKAKIQGLETDLMKSELNNKNKDLTNMLTNLSYKRKFIDEVQDKLKSLQNQPESEVNEQVNLIIREFNSYKNTDKSMAILQSNIDKVNISFFEKLGRLFPLLTENEKELCGLFLLKLSSKDIANLRNVTPDAIKKARQRIRKKLPISEEQELSAFLENI